MLSKQECVEVICEIYRQSLPAEQSVPEVTEETRLFGSGALLDSSALVSLLVEVEQQINDKAGTDIVLVDDQAMSQKRSPFRSIGTLAEYVVMLLNEKNDAV